MAGLEPATGLQLYQLSYIHKEALPGSNRLSSSRGVARRGPLGWVLSVHPERFLVPPR